MPRKHPNNPVGIQPYPATANLCPKTLCPIIKKIDESPTRFSESLLDKYRELNNKFAVLKSNFYDKGYEQILANYYNGIIENEELLKEAMRYLEEILTVTEQMAQISNESLFALKTDSIIDLYQIRDWYNEMYNLSAKYSLAETYGELKIENGELKINNVEIFDVYGRKIHSFTPSLLHSLTPLRISTSPTSIRAFISLR